MHNHFSVRTQGTVLILNANSLADCTKGCW